MTQAEAVTNMETAMTTLHAAVQVLKNKTLAGDMLDPEAIQEQAEACMAVEHGLKAVLFPGFGQDAEPAPARRKRKA